MRMSLICQMSNHPYIINRVIWINSHNLSCSSVGRFNPVAEGKTFFFCLLQELTCKVPGCKVDIDTSVELRDFSNGFHEKVLRFVVLPTERTKKHPSFPTGVCFKQTPIGQAGAPYLQAGCCAVNELVSRALSIGCVHYNRHQSVNQGKPIKKYLFPYSCKHRETQGTVPMSLSQEQSPKKDHKNTNKHLTNE